MLPGPGGGAVAGPSAGRISGKRDATIFAFGTIEVLQVLVARTLPRWSASVASRLARGKIEDASEPLLHTLGSRSA